MVGRILMVLIVIGLYNLSLAQSNLEIQDSVQSNNYRKRVLQSVEVDVLSSYYQQDGTHAAVTGGRGTEALQDVTGTVIISVPISRDEVLTIDAGVSAYTSASSSNVNPFDRKGQGADPFIASSGESRGDVWSSGSLNYSHHSDDRNRMLGVQLSYANEYDYTSFGIGGRYSILANEQNTELNVNASAFFDQWQLIYPIELRAFGLIGADDEDEDFRLDPTKISGVTSYQPRSETLSTTARNSYSLGLGFSQVISQSMQTSIAVDWVRQHGLLSTPFQRVHFQDWENAMLGQFHLADDIERLPSVRNKLAIGMRWHIYLNEFLTVRTFYRYYLDSWDLRSHTANIEIPIKVWRGQIAFFPSYRYYFQSGIRFFAPYDQHLSSSTFYTSDFDLSRYHAQQWGLGLGYYNKVGKLKLWRFSMNSVELKYYRYTRNISFDAHLVTLGIKFRM